MSGGGCACAQKQAGAQTKSVDAVSGRRRSSSSSQTEPRPRESWVSRLGVEGCEQDGIDDDDAFKLASDVDEIQGSAGAVLLLAGEMDTAHHRVERANERASKDQAAHVRVYECRGVRLEQRLFLSSCLSLFSCLGVFFPLVQAAARFAWPCF